MHTLVNLSMRVLCMHAVMQPTLMDSRPSKGGRAEGVCVCVCVNVCVWGGGEPGGGGGGGGQGSGVSSGP